MAILEDLSSIIGGYSKLYFLAVGLISAAGVWATLPLEMTSAGPQTDVRPTIPVADDVQAGRALFEKHCVTCHGPRGRGDGLAITGATVADLSSPTTQRKLNADLLTTIHEGRPGKVMPSWEYRFSKDQLRDVLAYVRTLKK
jgi:mono/diheme cytochrome c family protein